MVPLQACRVPVSSPTNQTELSGASQFKRVLRLVVWEIEAAGALKSNEMWLTSEAAAGVAAAAASFCKTFFFSPSKRAAAFLRKINDLPVFGSRISVHTVL